MDMGRNRGRSSKENLKIKIGYISSEFGDGENRDFLPVYFGVRDKVLFKTYGYTLRDRDGVSEMMAEAADGWRDLRGKSPEEAARLIKRDAIDILVDISFGKTGEDIVDIMKLRPAPVQLSLGDGAIETGEGARGTSPSEKSAEGADTIPSSSWTDAFIRDKHETPKGQLNCRLCYIPFETSQDYAVTAPFTEVGSVTFGVTGAVAPELAEEYVRALNGILEEVPGARLCLFPDAAGCIKNAMGKEPGSLFGDSAIIPERVDNPLLSIDILLFTGNRNPAFLCKAIHDGIPAIPLNFPGHSRPLKGFWESLGLGSLWAVTTPDSIRIAKELAEDGDRLCRLHRELRWRMRKSPAMDSGSYAIELEGLYGRLFLEKNHGSGSLDELLKKVNENKALKDWDRVLPLGAEFIHRGGEDTETLMTMAWGYYFKGDSLRSLYWLDRAEEAHAAHPVSRQYLMACAYSKMGRWEKLMEHCERAFSLEKAGEKMIPEASDDMVMMQAGASYRIGKEPAKHFIEAMDRVRSFADRCQSYSSWLLTHNTHDVDEEELFRKHRGYEELFKDIPRYEHPKSRHSHKKIRVGYISPDFCAHVMSYFCWPFLATYDRERFEVYVYSIGKTDQYTEAFRTLVDKWRDISKKDYSEIAEIVYGDEIDILFDLAGHTSNTGLPVLAWKPAPVQISGLGYMATTGLSEVDYFLTDGFVDPPGVNDRLFVEKLLRVTSQFCYNGATNLPQSAGAPFRKRGRILFGSFNQYQKITDDMLILWKEILSKVPGSLLLVKTTSFADPDCIDTAYSHMEEIGLPMDRIMLEPPSRKHMLRYLDVDIALDTYPYPGGATTCDALYMGVPVVTLYGTRHSTRFSYGILAAAGLAELTAATPEEYVERAVSLAREPELLDALHLNLRTMMQKSPLMDPQGYINEVEAHYLRIWEDYATSTT